jgi:Flp pilus assembly protein TadD
MKKLRILAIPFLCLTLACCATTSKKKALPNDKNPQYQYDKAVVAMKYGLPDQALDYLGLALTLDPNHSRALGLRGMIRLQAGDRVSAVEDLEKSLAIEPQYVEALNNLGTAYKELGRKEESEAAFLRAFAVDGNALAGFNLARIQFEKNRFPEALDYIDKTILKADWESGAYNLKGVILNQMGRYAECLAAFRTALALNPGDVNAAINLGIALMNAGESGPAIEVFEKALPAIQDPAQRKRVDDYLKTLREAIK